MPVPRRREEFWKDTPVDGHGESLPHARIIEGLSIHGESIILAAQLRHPFKAALFG